MVYTLCCFWLDDDDDDRDGVDDDDDDRDGVDDDDDRSSVGGGGSGDYDDVFLSWQ